MNDRLNDQCPRCGAGRLKTWLELGAEEREVVLRLPGSADYPAKERKNGHRWCPRCWHESTGQIELA